MLHSKIIPIETKNLLVSMINLSGFMVNLHGFFSIDFLVKKFHINEH